MTGDWLRGICWILSLGKPILNAPGNHCLDNVALLSSFCIPIKQNVQKDVLIFKVSSSRDGQPWSISLIMKSVQVAVLDLLGNSGHARRGRAPDSCLAKLL